MERVCDFQTRRKHLENLTDEQLKQKFWELADKIVAPMLELGKKNTSPSIERSVLLRMGFSSIEAKGIVEKCIDYNLMRKGAGHVVYRLSKEKNLSVRDAGLALAEGKYWDDMVKIFEGGK